MKMGKNAIYQCSNSSCRWQETKEWKPIKIAMCSSDSDKLNLLSQSLSVKAGMLVFYDMQMAAMQM